MEDIDKRIYEAKKKRDELEIRFNEKYKNQYRKSYASFIENNKNITRYYNAVIICLIVAFIISHII